MLVSRARRWKPGVPAIRGAIWSLVITLLALAAITTLHQIPIFGVANAVEHRGAELVRTHTVAAVALPSWLLATTFAQLGVIFLPERWTHWITRNGYANPFSWLVLLATATIAWSNGNNIIANFTADDPMIGHAQPAIMPVVSLLGGTGAVIACAWLIERFGLGHGFWMVFAMQAVTDLLGNVPLWPVVIEPPPLGHFAYLAIGATFFTLVAMTVLVTIRVADKTNRATSGPELVAWPLLLTPVAIIGADYRKHAPEIIPAFFVLTLLALVAIVFAMTRRKGELRLFVPILAVLALLETAAYVALYRFPFGLPIPLPTAGFVATLVLLTVVVWQHLPKRRTSTQACKSRASRDC